MKREILAKATSREDFIDHDKFSTKELFGCRCEVRFWAGDTCKHNLGKRADNTARPNNDHWQWEIDIAPRGYVCPRALERHLAREDGDPPVQGCPILLFNEPPSEAWVLAQDPNDPVGTLAGRAVSDQIRTNDLCHKCAGAPIGANNRLERDQSRMFTYNGEDTFPIQPYLYKPSNGSAQPCYPLLTVGAYYHLKDLRQFKGVKLDDIWMPNVRVGDGQGRSSLGCTLMQWNGVMADVAREWSNDGVVVDQYQPGFRDEVVRRLNPPTTPQQE